jgi:predicted NAD/FAD-dependent oxidoreductase
MGGQTHVIGAGLAGLSAALALVDAGRRVTVYEAGPAAGGRCRSYPDRALGLTIDNGNHLLLSGNAAAFGYLDRIGARDTMGGPAEPVFPFVDIPTGQRWTVRPNRGRLPWWIFSAARRVPGTKATDYLALLGLRFLSDNRSVAACSAPWCARR